MEALPDDWVTMRKPTPICVLLCACCVILGATISPHAEYLCVKTILRFSPSSLRRLKAASSLAESDAGRDHLYGLVLQERIGDASVAMSALCAVEKPWQVHSMLGQLREQHREEEYVELLDALDYVEQHRMVLAALEYEIERQDDERLRSRIVQIVEAFAKIYARGDHISLKQGSRDEMEAVEAPYD